MAERRALFESWRGRYSDSPRVISERLGTVAPDIERRWVASRASAFPSDVTLLSRHRPRHFASLATCDLLVTNDIVTRHLVKGPRVIYVQAWHGSPIKVIGLDEIQPRYRHAAAHRQRMLRDVAKWDYLLSPSEVYTEIFRGAFGYDGEVLEVGYPRNDILVNDDGSRRGGVRRELGIADGQVAVLYAPTWRDDAHDAAGGFYQPALVDWDLLERSLPESVVVLNRLHHHVHADRNPGTRARIRDVSQHEDVTDLLLASDALISDYSSIIYDYAVTGRPIILHVPDLDRYRAEVRAFYFDYESWAPGPITASTGELVDKLLALTDVESEFAQAYGSFVKTYCTFEDGHASERVVARLLERALG